MTIGTRGKLFAVSLVLIVVVGGTAGVYLERELKAWLEARIEGDLTRLSRVTAVALATAARGPADEAQIDGLADALGAASAARVTIIAADGRVIGDSLLDRDGLRTAENHRSRPEIQAAFSGQLGAAHRRSVTVGKDMLYVAAPYSRGPGAPGAVRVAMPLSNVEQLLGRLRLLMLVAGAVGLAIAVVMSWLASHLLSRALRRLVVDARAIARGEGRRLCVSSADELGSIAGSFNRLAEQMRHTVLMLAQERDRFETVLDEMSEAVLSLDEEQRVTLANPAAVQLLNLKAAPIGEPLLDVVRVPVLKELVSQANTEFKLPSAEVDVPGRETRRVLARVTPLRGTGGNVLVMHDITEMRRLETIRRDFVANVSHELRTPVSIILANAETLKNGALDDPEHARGFVEALVRNGERLSRIVADLLDLSRIESGQFAIESQPVAAAPAICRAVEAVQAMAADKSQTMESEAAEGLIVRADSKALDQVLLNLLHNAVKYTPVDGRITVTARREEVGVMFEVTDNGPGIAPKHRDRVFERFYRVDRGRSREKGDTGLGLSIVKHLVEAMGGRAGMRPAEPSGAVFWFVIPEAINDDDDDDDGAVPE